MKKIKIIERITFFLVMLSLIVMHNTSMAQYCVPEGTNSGRYINNFSTTGGIDNISNLASGFSADGYGDFTATHKVSGVETYFTSFDFTVDMVGGSTGLIIWIDWNNDEDFDFTGERVFMAGHNSTASKSGTIMIPQGTAQGEYRMRVMSSWFGTDGPSGSMNNYGPCGTAFTYGEFEDYTIEIVAATTCSGTPIVGTLDDFEFCKGREFLLTMDGGTAYQDGLAFEWFSSTDGNNWTSIYQGNVPDYIMPGITEETQFKLEISCQGGAVVSDTLTVSLKPFTDEKMSLLRSLCMQLTYYTKITHRWCYNKYKLR